jgi:prenylcysteine oxidase/farnesylcysteine lyase
MKVSSLTSIAAAWLSVAASDVYTHQDPHQHVFDVKPEFARPLPRPRVAIIGGGAAGSSSAFFLTFLAEHNPSLAVDIDLFEASDYIGGRSTFIHPFGAEGDNDLSNDDVRSPALELGASIFVPANKNLWKAVKEFNLILQDGHGGGKTSEEDAGGMSIWNGESFVYRESSWAWWVIPKLVWRYGLGPLTTRDAVKATVDKFVALYGADFQRKGPYEGIASFGEGLGLQTLAFQSTSDYLKSLKVGSLFIQELVGAATCVNYGQAPSRMHACKPFCNGCQLRADPPLVQGMVSMAGAGASSVKGGNRRIFEEFVARSNARVHLLTQVSTITKQEDRYGREWLIRYQDVESGITSTQEYDAIIYAAPLHPPTPVETSAVRFVNSDIPSRIPVLPYVHLYVTLVVTNATNPRSAFFNTKEKVPNTILATLDPHEVGRIAKRPKVNSMNYLRNLGKLDDERGVGHVVKSEQAVSGLMGQLNDTLAVFTSYELSDDDLTEAFGETEVLWVHRKDWASYPEAPPFGDDELLPAFKPDNSSYFYYTSAFERWVSTMETSVSRQLRHCALRADWCSADCFGLELCRFTHEGSVRLRSDTKLG